MHIKKIKPNTNLLIRMKHIGVLVGRFCADISLKFILGRCISIDSLSVFVSIYLRYGISLVRIEKIKADDLLLISGID